jgi:hypothetical protein
VLVNDAVVVLSKPSPAEEVRRRWRLRASLRATKRTIWPIQAVKFVEVSKSASLVMAMVAAS